MRHCDPVTLQPIDIFTYQCYYPAVIQTIIRGICDLVYPPNCFICKNYLFTQHNSQPSPKAVLCLDCEQKIQFNIPPFCPKCSRHLRKTLKKPYCQECLMTKPHFDFAWGACLYNEPLQQLIHAFKYGQKTLLRHFFAQQMIAFIENYELDIRQFDVIVPIPLSSTRLRERGYNQSLMLAQGLSEQYQIPISYNNLIRIKHTKSQTLLNQKDRWTNLVGAFRIKPLSNFFGKNILIIDDLLTTGATASMAALALKQHGAQTVGVLTLAIVAANDQPS